MAGFLRNDTAKSADYCGLDGIFEYVNADGQLCRWNCGQAAAATCLTHLGAFEADVATAAQVMQRLETEHPPDQVGGYFGSSRRRVERIARSFGFAADEVAGRDELCAALARQHPVIVMLGVSAGAFLGFDLPGGHWMVAYGYDAEQVHLTNGGAMPWSEFETGWTRLVPRLIQMSQRGLVLSRPATATV